LLEKFDLVNLLFDFYGRLLTDRQRSFVELYYCQNLSLGEIAEEYSVTRQAVHDTLKRAEQQLFSYEEKLGLVARYREERARLAEALSIIDEYLKYCSSEKVHRAREILAGILKQ